MGWGAGGAAGRLEGRAGRFRDGAEGLLPELELDRRVQLGEARVQVALERVRVLQVDRVRLVRVLGHVRQVKTQRLAQAAEFNLALVLQAELEGLQRNLLAEARRESGASKTCGGHTW